YRLYRSCRLLFLPGGVAAVFFPQARKLCGFLYNTCRESASRKRAVYHTIAPEGQTELGRRQATEPAAPLRRPQLALAAGRAVGGLQQHLCPPLGEPAL